jgi:hypothetical protein
MVVVPEPAVKGGGALGAVAVDRAVGPARQQRADEALGLAVRLRPVGPCAEVPDPERATGDRVGGRAVGRTVVGQHALDLDPLPVEEGDRPAQEADRCCRLLVSEHLGVGEPAAVVDRDVDEVPANRFALADVGIDAVEASVALEARDPLAGAAMDPAELLDVDMDELAGALALVALAGLEPNPAELAQTEPGQDAGDGR